MFYAICKVVFHLPFLTEILCAPHGDKKEKWEWRLCKECQVYNEEDEELLNQIKLEHKVVNKWGRWRAAKSN